MSWIVGFLASVPVHSDHFIRRIHPHPLFRIDRPGIYLAAGGNPLTCRFGVIQNRTDDDSTTWIVVGSGLERIDDRCRILSDDAWSARLASEPASIDRLDGHFIVLQLSRGRVRCQSDTLGLRTFYAAETDHGVFFSTRLDWVSCLNGGMKIDWESFGSHWMTFQQLKPESLLEGVRRLGPAGKGEITARTVRFQHQPLKIETTETDRISPARSLRAMTHPNLDPGDKISLGLSGGMDSRVLLSMMLGRPELAVHVFGRPDDPDVVISKRISDALRLPRRHFFEPTPGLERCLSLLREQAAKTCAITPASFALTAKYYESIHSAHTLMLDGGFGEIVRRSFFNRLNRLGRKALVNGDPKAIFPHIRFTRADVFNQEAERSMRLGIERDLADLWSAMPPESFPSPEDFLDWLSVLTRLPNFYGHEQARLDEILPNYMPFAQPSVIHRLLAIPAGKRRNGAFSRKLIGTSSPMLSRFPLVKGGATYPFEFRGMAAWVWIHLKRRLSGSFRDPTETEFLNRLKPWILDTVHSSQFKAYTPYNHQSILRLVEQYYSGRMELGRELDWWISFESWRQAARITG